MNLILTMAGQYQRFIDEGYRIPKYLLPWGDKTILHTIINELNTNKCFDNVFLVANKRDDIYMPHVRRINKSLGIPAENLILISDTLGQVHTAYEALLIIEHIINDNSQPVAFHNIDTILYNRNFTKLSDMLKKYDGFVDVFRSNNHNYSYVLEKNNIINAIEEKILISDLATSGFYAFSNITIFKEHFNENDHYISQLYKHMINNNCKIIISEPATEKDTIVLGTPSSYLTSSYILDLENKIIKKN